MDIYNINQSCTMLGKIMPRFVIAGVIQNAYYANYMAVDLTKQIIANNINTYEFDNAKKYFECNFYGYLSTLQKPTEFVDQFEVEKYDEACEKFAEYNQVKFTIDQLTEFTVEIKELFRVVEANNTSSNFLSRASATDEVWEEDLYDCLSRYNELLTKLEPYPEWHSKVMFEVGKWFHMIYNNLGESKVKTTLFSKLNAQEYFA